MHLNSTGFEQFGYFHYDNEITATVNPYGSLYVDGDERMVETDYLGARILMYNDTNTKMCLFPDCTLNYDAHCSSCEGCLIVNGSGYVVNQPDCEPGCKSCTRGYYVTNRTLSGRCERCNLKFPHCEVCERVLERGVETPVRCLGCDPLFVLHDGECVSDGVIEFVSPRYHAYQDSAYVDVAITRNLIRNSTFLQNVTILIQSEDLTAKSKSLLNNGDLAHYRETTIFTTFRIPHQKMFPEIIGTFRDDAVDWKTLNKTGPNELPSAGSPRRLTHLDPFDLGHML